VTANMPESKPMRFVMRCVHGAERGKYLHDAALPPVWTDDVAVAKTATPVEASSFTAGLLDNGFIAVPEAVGEVDEHGCRLYADTVCHNMFQSPSDATVQIVYTVVIRRGSSAPLPTPDSDLPESQPGFISVFEWLCRSIGQA
jgi:hypothetical protein